MTHNWLRLLVPREWSAHQALLAVNLLKQASEAIWAVHGEDMTDALGGDTDYRHRVADYVEFDEDEIPY